MDIHKNMFLSTTDYIRKLETKIDILTNERDEALERVKDLLDIVREIRMYCCGNLSRLNDDEIKQLKKK